MITIVHIVIVNYESLCTVIYRFKVEELSDLTQHTVIKSSGEMRKSYGLIALSPRVRKVSVIILSFHPHFSFDSCYLKHQCWNPVVYLFIF